MNLLLDTHIWIWSHLEPERLSKKVQAALIAPDAQLWLSPISVWEFLLLCEKKRILIKGDANKWVESALSLAPMHEATLNREVALRSRAIKVPHQDPADRFLAATAEVFDLVLVTDDAHLLAGKGYAKLANR